MNTKMMLLTAMAAITIAGQPSTADANGLAFGRSQAPAPLEGTWVVTIRPIGCATGVDVPGIQPVISHLTFAHGGTMTEATSNPAFGPGRRSAGHGSWERTGRTSYQFAMQAFLNEPNAPYKTGLQRIEQTVELHTEDEWTSSGPVQFFETFDLSLNPGLVPYRAGCARANGVRLY
jgi:hypothetical protein